MYTMEFFSVIKKEFRSFSGKWIQLKIPISSKSNQTQKSKYHIFLSPLKVCRIVYTDGAEVEIRPGLDARFRLTVVSLDSRLQNHLAGEGGVIYG